MKIFDKKIFNLINKEYKRQKNCINLIASENIISKNLILVKNNILNNKYAEGYPGKRYYAGCKYIDLIEQIAINRAKKLFCAKFVNVQPYSGTQANMAAYLSLINYGDNVLGMGISSGGHLTHGSKVNFSGKNYNFIYYDINKNTELIDYDIIEKKAIFYKVKLIVAGFSSYSRNINFEKIRKIANKVNSKLLIDISHIAGFIASGIFKNPLKIADIVTTTTHKTLRGPRGGMILTNNYKISKKINKNIFPMIQGGPLQGIIACKAIAFKEATKKSFKNYCIQMIKNSKAMAKIFNSCSKIHVVSKGTDNHLLVLDLTKFNINGKEAEIILESVNIIVNKNLIPFDKLNSLNPSGIRIGTASITTRGFDEKNSERLANLIINALEFKNNKFMLKLIKLEVKFLIKKYSFIYF